MSKKKNFLNDFDALDRKRQKAKKKSIDKFDPIRKNKKYFEKNSYNLNYE